MKTVRTNWSESFRRWFCLLCFASIALVQLRSEEAGITNKLQWGTPCEGLQLGVEIDESTDGVFCWIRNISTNTVRYNDYYLAGASLVHVSILLGTNFSAVKIKDVYVFPVLSAGPSAGYNKAVSPGEFIKSTTRKDRRTNGRTFPTSIKEELIYTSLSLYEWPKAAVEEKHIKIKISQVLSSPVGKSGPDGIKHYALESPIIELDYKRFIKLVRNTGE